MNYVDAWVRYLGEQPRVLSRRMGLGRDTLPMALSQGVKRRPVWLDKLAELVEVDADTLLNHHPLSPEVDSARDHALRAAALRRLTGRTQYLFARDRARAQRVAGLAAANVAAVFHRQDRVRRS